MYTISQDEQVGEETVESLKTVTCETSGSDDEGDSTGLYPQGNANTAVDIFPRELIEKYAMYTLHGLYIVLMLVGWAIWRPLVILLPITGVVWEISRGCPLTYIEIWMTGEHLLDHPTWRSRVLLWLDLFVYIVVGWFL